MKYRAALIIALSFTVTSIAEARSPRVQQVPNGVEFSCQTCHNAVFPTGPQDSERNAFGTQVENHLSGSGAPESQQVDWQALHALDADGDGYTNGEELGDPDGEWVPGEDPPRSYDPSHPADADSHQCDNLDLPQANSCPGGEDAGSGGEDAGSGGEDAGSGGEDAGVSADTGTEDNAGGDSGSEDEGCSATGMGHPGTSAGALALIGLGLVALRRRFLS